MFCRFVLMSGYGDLLEPALEIGVINEDFDPSVPPATGQEYIQRVVLEASRCEGVVVAEIDRSRFKKQTININAAETCPVTPSHLMPTLEWQQCQVADFSSLRQALARRKAAGIPVPSYKLPNIEDEGGWYSLCFGCDMKLVEKEGTSDEGLRPLVSVLLSMNQPMIEQLLEYHVDWLKNRSELSLQQGRWLFALLACLELPLVPETCSVLRTLARKCACIRAAVEETADHPVVAPLNLLICLVARYFRQMDLADP
ncbi:gem-associated protein 2 isoform X1 [Anabrus simplex]|uniref:gem-associated protein 2 isoform X1 n=1 Tax=Anabrus simplex TaxID=316456 RepID=UPI0034DD6E32